MITDMIFLGIVLLIFAVIDYKVKCIPSIFLTGTLFIMIFLNPGNIFYGILALVFALILYESEYVGGIADIKVICMIGLTISNQINFGIFVVMVMFFGTIWKVAMKYISKEKEECPFIPSLFIVYLGLLILKLVWGF